MKTDIERIKFYIKNRKQLQKGLDYATIEEAYGDIETLIFFIKNLDDVYGHLKEKYPEYFI